MLAVLVLVVTMSGMGVGIHECRSMGSKVAGKTMEVY